LIFFYQLTLILIIVSCLPLIVPYIFFKKDAKFGLHERLSIYPGRLKKKLKDRNVSLWVHAASVGEIRLLKNIPDFPRQGTVISCLTPQGKRVAEKLYPEMPVIFLPADIVFFIKRLKRILNPQKVLIIETEIWPGFIYSLRHIPVILFNARLSGKKFPFYKKTAFLLKKVFNWIDKIYAMDAVNYRRFLEFGINEKKITVLGNLKYNYTPPDIKNIDGKYSQPGIPVVVCGSTHKGEEEALSEVFLKLREKVKELVFIVSPRHLERIKDVRKLMEGKGIAVSLWSEKKGQIKAGEAFIVDTMGELASVYSLASVVFIGGTLYDYGGHNVIEAAACRKPVIVGPFGGNFKTIISDFQRAGGLEVAKDGKDLYNIILSLLRDREKNRIYGEKNYGFFSDQRGKVRDSLDKLDF